MYNIYHFLFRSLSLLLDHIHAHCYCPNLWCLCGVCSEKTEAEKIVCEVKKKRKRKKKVVGRLYLYEDSQISLFIRLILTFTFRLSDTLN